MDVDVQKVNNREPYQEWGIFAAPAMATRPPTHIRQPGTLALIEAAASDLRYQTSLIDWVLEQKLPQRLPVGQLIELVSIALDSGQLVEDLPHNVQPDTVTRLALNGFAMTGGQAIIEAASLRAFSLCEEVLVQSAEGLAAWQALIPDRGVPRHHQLLNIDQMLTDFMPLIELIVDADLATEVRIWLGVQPDLDPVLAVHALRPEDNAVDSDQEL